MIRDRLVCGINKYGIQKRLLTEVNAFTLVKAISIAQSYETAEKDATKHRPTTSTQSPTCSSSNAPQEVLQMWKARTLAKCLSL